MSNDKPDGKKQRPLGRPEPLNDADLMMTHRQCPATSKRTGERCKRYCAPGQRTCLWHGSATRRAKTAAAKRIAHATGYAADMLVEFMADPEIDLKLRTHIAQDLLDRGGVNAKKIMELTVEKGRSFADVTADVVLGPGWDDDANVDIIDAEVVELDDPSDEERWDREDMQRERRKEIERMKRGTPSSTPSDLNAQRARQEAAAIRAHARGELGDDDLLPEQAAYRDKRDKFGVLHDTSAQRRGEARVAAARKRDDKTVRVRGTSTADPYADRVQPRGGGRSMSPKRWAERNGGGNG